MNFLYKINSGFSGPGGRFTPQKLPERLQQGRYLVLGWKRYLEAVDRGDRVWIYFTGPQRFDAGVYAQGRVARIDLAGREVLLRVTRHSVTRTLTDPETTARIAEVVSRWYEQVFVLPDRWSTAPICSIERTAESCGARKCEWCPTWKALPLIRPADLARPDRLAAEVSAFAPAYWAVPSRSYLPRSKVSVGVAHTTDVFKSFKAGNPHLAHPLALGIYEALVARGVALDFDAIVPVPLSPDKARRKEIHRTLLLSRELQPWLDAPVKQVLSLAEPISKRALLSQGYGAWSFEVLYDSKLVVTNEAKHLGRVLLVDDVCTHGSTLSCGARALRGAGVSEVVGATGAQMILKRVVRNETRLRADG